MVDLGAHFFPPATIPGEDGATLELVSPFLPPVQCGSDLSFSQVKLVTYKVENLLGVQF